MKTDRGQLIDVFTGSPWEVELVKSLLQAANVQTLVSDKGEMSISVPQESYSTAVKILSSRI